MNLRVRLALSVLAVAAPVLFALAWLRVAARERAQEDLLAQGVRALMTDESRALCESDPGAWSRRLSAQHPSFHEPEPDNPGGRPPPPHGGSERPPPRWPGEPPPDGHHGPPGGPPDGFMLPPVDQADGGRPRRPGGGPRGRAPLPAELFPYAPGLTPSVPGSPELSSSLRVKTLAGVEVASAQFHERSARVVDVLVRMPWASGPCAYILARHKDPPQQGALVSLLSELLLPAGVVVGVMLLALGPVVERIRRLAQRVGASAQAHYALPIDVVGSDELAELSYSFNAAASEVRQQMDAQAQRERTLRDFLDNTTHDLMTPLTVLTGHLATLEDAAQAGEAPDRETIKGAMNEAHYMASLVHNLGAAARLEAGEPQIVREPVSLASLVERAVGRLRPIARIHQVSLDHAVPPDPPAVLGDMTLIEQAISNVVQNAIKHNQPGGHVAVVLDVDGGSFTLDVLDDGPGIPDADIERLRRPRERGDGARTRDPHGRGLGLSITQRVADAHGWGLSFGPSDFGGLRVRFTGSLLRGPSRVSWRGEAAG